ncbi:unnamed protein product, partial [Heterosigma akashiwo]
QVLAGEVCRHLLSLSQAADPAILSLTLRVIFNCFNCMKDQMKVQLEVFLTSVHLRLGRGAQRPSGGKEAEELALESLLEFCREPALMADIYLNYDCDVQCTNLFEVRYQCYNMASTTLLPLDHCRLALEGLYAIVDSIARRCEDAPESSSAPTPPGGGGGGAAAPLAALVFGAHQGGQDNPALSSWGDASGSSPAASDWPGEGEEEGQGGPSSSADHEEDAAWLAAARQRTAEILRQRKRHKTLLALAAEHFNRDEGKGFVKYAQELGLLESGAMKKVDESLGFVKKTLVDFCCRGPEDKYPFNAQVLKAYCAQFDFKGKTFDQSLRFFLESFRLPGEAQCIDRLMEAFAKEFYAQNHEDARVCPFASTDGAFILAFSVIMLNTDLHNPQIKEEKRMKLAEFLRNNRGINDGQDLPEAYLSDIYSSIRDNEIQVH